MISLDDSERLVRSPLGSALVVGSFIAAGERLLAYQRQRAELGPGYWVAVGEAGTGKRALLEIWCRLHRARGRVVALDCARLDPEELSEAIAQGGSPALGLSPGDVPLLLSPQRLPARTQDELAELDRRLFLSFQALPERLSPALRRRFGGVHLLPALREVPDEIAIYFERLLGLLSPGEPPTLDPSAVGALRRHPWPGNFRELRHVAQRLLLGGAGPVVRAEELHFDGGMVH